MKKDNLEESPEMNTEELAELLTQMRIEKGLTQSQLAELSDCTLRTIQNFEAANENVSDNQKIKIASALGFGLRKLYVVYLEKK